MPASPTAREVRFSSRHLAAWGVGLALTAPLAAADTEVRDGLVYTIGAPDDQPYFPFGIFVEVNDGIQGRQNTLETLGPLGIQPLWNTPGASEETLDGTAEALDRAAQLGVDIAIQLNAESPAGDAFLVRRKFPERDGLFGYYHTDDVERGVVSPSELRSRDAAVKAADPNHVTIFSYGDGADQSLDDLRRYADGADVVMRQSYPVSHNPISKTYEQIRDLSIAVSEPATPRVPVALLQTFNWAEQGSPQLGDRNPTPDELVAMSYLSLAAGSKGLWYYTFGQGDSETSTLDVTDPALFDAIAGVREDVGVIGDAVLLGDRIVLSESDDLYVAAWLEGDAFVAAAVDTRTGGGTRTSELTIDLPEGFMASLLRGDESSLTLTESGLRVSLAAGQTSVLFAAVPEPATATLFAGLLLLAGRGRSRGTFA